MIVVGAQKEFSTDLAILGIEPVIQGMRTYGHNAKEPARTHADGTTGYFRRVRWGSCGWLFDADRIAFANIALDRFAHRHMDTKHTFEAFHILESYVADLMLRLYPYYDRKD